MDTQFNNNEGQSADEGKIKRPRIGSRISREGNNTSYNYNNYNRPNNYSREQNFNGEYRNPRYNNVNPNYQNRQNRYNNNGSNDGNRYNRNNYQNGSRNGEFNNYQNQNRRYNPNGNYNSQYNTNNRYSNNNYNNNNYGYNNGGSNNGYKNYRNNNNYNNNYGNNNYGNNRSNKNGQFRNNNFNNYQQNNRYSNKKQYEYRDSYIDLSQPMRLNKFIANSGLCSRREADEYITAGVITVNGNVVTELGTKIIPATDSVYFHDQPVKTERKVYILLNKPKDCVTTVEDTHARFTVLDLVKNACKERVYPVGRLDRNTTGVLLITNDGDLTSKLTHPKFDKKKIYQVTLDRDITDEDFHKIVDGITLEDGVIKVDEICFVKEGDRRTLGVEIHSGKNRIVRRLFDALNYHVIKLDRVYFAGLTKKNLPRGKWRYLSDKEVNLLKMNAASMKENISPDNSNLSNIEI